MKVIFESKKIPGLKLIKPETFHDFRGEYVETYSREKYLFHDLSGNPIEFVEDDVSVSVRNTLRGLHGDSKTWKLIQCLAGSFYLAIADMRQDLPSYLNVEQFSLNEKNRHQLLVPAGCVNGHLVMSERCIFSYKQSQYYSGAQNQITVRWDDPKLDIYWPITNPILSQRDAQAALIAE